MPAGPGRAPGPPPAAEPPPRARPVAERGRKAGGQPVAVEAEVVGVGPQEPAYVEVERHLVGLAPLEGRQVVGPDAQPPGDGVDLLPARRPRPAQRPAD